MSHSHLITIEKVNRHYILYFRDIIIKSFPTLTAAKQYGDFFQLDSHTRYAIYLIHNFGNCTGNNLGYYTGTIGLQGDIYVPGHVPTINGEVKLYKTFARAKQGAQAIYNKCGYVQKFEIHTIEIRANDKRVVKEYSRRFNVWEVARGLNKTKHPAVFPERLANDHILSWSNKGDVVLDPFCGSGTTAKMAMLTGRKFIGFEISAEYCDIAEKRIASVGKDIPLFEAD